MKQYKAQVDKATAEFEKYAADYSTLLSQIVSKDEGVIYRSTSMDDGKTGKASSPEQISVEFETFTIVDAALIEERRNEMLHVAREAEALKEIMKDMSLLVNEQGEQLDTIAEGIVDTKEKIEKGNIELGKVGGSLLETPSQFTHHLCFIIILGYPSSETQASDDVLPLYFFHYSPCSNPCPCSQTSAPICLKCRFFTVLKRNHLDKLMYSYSYLRTFLK